ncbi:MAG: hypothetical protein U0441_14430 [Polyangiaceae bacterium]
MPRDHITKKNSKGGDAIAAAPETTKTYTLPNLVKKLGPSKKEEVDHYIEGLDKDELTYEGSRVSTERIDTDAARLYGRAADFLKSATEEQQDALMGVSPDYVRVGVWAALQGSQAFEALQKTKRSTGGTKEQLAIAAEKVRVQAMARRKALRSGLEALAAGDRALLARIDHANGTAKEPKTLAEALSALADIGESLLHKPSPSLTVRLKNARLTKEMLEKDRALASKAREVGEEAEGVVGSDGDQVTQSNVDRWDGINLFLLGNLIRVFEAGHAQDPEIPRLSPITLFNYFSRRNTGAKEPGAKTSKKSAAANNAAAPEADKKPG